MNIISAGGCGRVPHQGKAISNKEAAEEVGSLKNHDWWRRKSTQKKNIEYIWKVEISHFASMATTPM